MEKDKNGFQWGGGADMKWSFAPVYAGKVVHAETTVAHAVLNGSQYYHQDWAHAAAHVITPPLRIEPNTPGYLMGLLGKYVLITGVYRLPMPSFSGRNNDLTVGLQAV